jgi:hypothetical protein
MRGIAWKTKHAVLVAGVGLTLALSAAPAQADPSAEGLAQRNDAATDTGHAYAYAYAYAVGMPYASGVGHRVS